MRLTKDFLSGLLFICLGGGFAVISTSYRFGSLEKMGPGYFPFMLGATIAVIGAAIAGRAAIAPGSSEPFERLHMRPLLLVLMAIIAFGVLIRSAGLVASVLALILISRFARTEGSKLELAIMLVVLTAIPVAVFVYGLQLNLPLWLF